MLRASSRRRYPGIWFLAGLLAFVIASASAQTTPSGPMADTRGFFALPVELDMDYGAANGDAIILRIQPLYTFPVADTWKLVHLDTLTLADAPGGIPEFPGGGRRSE